MSPPESSAAYRRRVIARMDDYLARCRRERIAREWAADAQRSIPDVERAAGVAEAAPA